MSGSNPKGVKVVGVAGPQKGGQTRGDNANGTSGEADQSGRVIADPRLLPLAVSAWAGAWLGTGEKVGWVGWALTGALILGAAIWACRQFRWLAVTSGTVTLILAGCGLLRLDAVTHNQVAEWAASGASVTVVGELNSDVTLDPPRGVMAGRARATVTTQEITGRGASWCGVVTVAITANGDLATSTASLPLGSTVHLEGLLRPRQPGDTTSATLTIRAPPTQIRPPVWWQRAGNRVRSSLREAMRWSPAAQAALLPSFVVGDTAHVTEATTAAFKATSLTHLMAVSGTNLALALAFTVGLARRCGLTSRWIRLIAVLSVVAFVVVCRGEPSVLRAAAMGLVTLAAIGPSMSGRRSPRHLAVAIIALLLYDPWLSRSLGFALSVAATGGIIWWGGRWQRSLERWLPGWLAEALAIPIAAQVATQPIITSLSGTVSVVGIVANALAAPFVGPATIVGLCAAVVQLFPGPLGASLGFVAGWCVQPILWIAAWLAATPAATWPWPATSLSLALMVTGCWALAMLLTRILHQPRFVIPLLIAMLLAPWWQPRPLGWPGPWRVMFCDVGQGDATLIRAGPQSAVVIDVGPAGPAARDCLRSSGISTVPVLILTHFHADHSGGLAEVLASMKVGQVVVNPLASPQADVARVQRLARDKGVAVVTGQVGVEYEVGEAKVQLIAGGASSATAVAGGAEDSPAENNSSLISRVSSGGVTALITGDAETEEQNALASKGLGEGVQVLKMPHHGAARQSPELWQETGAVLAVASVGLRNTYGHPTPTALNLAARLGMRVKRTDQQGSVAIALVDGQLQVRTQRSGVG